MKDRNEIFQLEFGILDLDQTIVDSRFLAKFYMKIAARFFGISRNPNSYSRRGLIIRPWMKKAGRSLRFKKLEEWLNLQIHKQELNCAVFPEVRELIERFRRAGGMIFVSTDSPGFAARARLSNTGLASKVQEIYSADDGSKRQHLDKIRRSLALETEEFSEKAFMISDGPRDILLCQEFGLARCIAVTHTLSKKQLSSIADPVTIIIHSFQELN